MKTPAVMIIASRLHRIPNVNGPNLISKVFLSQLYTELNKLFHVWGWSSDEWNTWENLDSHTHKAQTGILYKNKKDGTCVKGIAIEKN